MEQECREAALDIYGGTDPRELPAYSVSEAAAWLQLPASTLRTWVHGRHYPTRSGEAFFEPLIDLPVMTVTALSFRNLVEAHVLAALRRSHNVPMHRVRSAVEYVQRRLGLPHPLARAEFATDGVHLFVDHMGELLNVSQNGQVAMRELLEASLRRIERDEQGLAARLYPWTRARMDERAPRAVVIDPGIAFGRPVVTGTGIPTAVLAEQWKAGDTIEELASDYGCDPRLVEEALRYEKEAA